MNHIVDNIWIMPIISSRTPEGYPGKCPICRTEVVLMPAEPLADAPCPACGVLLWPLAADQKAWLFNAESFTAEERAKLTEIAAVVANPNMDSLDRVELVMELEDMLDLSIPDEVTERWNSLDDFFEWWRNRNEPHD